MNFNLLQKMSIALCATIVMTSATHPEGQFEKLVYKKIPKQLSDCAVINVQFSDEQGNINTVGAAFNSCVTNFARLFTDFANRQNNEHARILAPKMRISLDVLQLNVIAPLSHHFTTHSATLDHKTQTALAALIKLLTKMHADLTEITNLLANYSGSLALLDLRNLGNSIMQEKWRYLLPERYYAMSTLEWKEILEKRYNPNALR